MLTVTEAAGEHLAELLTKQGAPEEVAVRFVREEQGVSLRPDSEKPGDATYEHGGRTILLLDNDAAELLADHTLELQGDQLALHAPKQGEE